MPGFIRTLAPALFPAHVYLGECYEFDRSEIINMTHGDAIKSDRGESGFKNVSNFVACMYISLWLLFSF